MKNKYRIVGNIVEIDIYSQSLGSYQTKVSLCDLPKLQRKNNTWRPVKFKNSNTIYVIGFDKKVNGYSKNILLHRYLLNPRDEEIIDHINGNGLDNTRENLRIVNGKINMRNRNKVNKNNTLDEPNITFVKDKGKYRVGFMEDRHFIFIGYFNDLKNAKKVRDFVKKLIEVNPNFNLFQNKEFIREKVKQL